LKADEEAIVEIATHQEIDARLCGEVASLTAESCRVTLTASRSMRADSSGLIHGGFVFGMADYAAMVAVNHPNVVLGAAETKFLKPVRVGDTLEAEAHIQERQGKRIFVAVTVSRGEDAVFQGLFTCFVPPRHVLDSN
jgi:acyl-coenzyme A thioesterase PaaI-like protein